VRSAECALTVQLELDNYIELSRQGYDLFLFNKTKYALKMFRNGRLNSQPIYHSIIRFVEQVRGHFRAFAHAIMEELVW
jgi:hypothetical protein